MISKEYVAGFIDGEGSIGLYKHKDKRVKRGFGLNPRLKIDNSNKRVLDLISKEYGGIVKEKKQGKYLPIYYLEWTSLEGLKKLLEKIIPHLHVKKEQAKTLLEYCSMRLDNYNKWYSGKEVEFVEKINHFNSRKG